jgi:hypothetical protein
VSDTNPDKIVDNILINRAEWLGCIVRLAYFKYGAGGQGKMKMPEATDVMLREDLLTRNSWVDGVFFRSRCVYDNPDLEKLLRANEEIIKKMYSKLDLETCKQMVKKAKLILRETQVDQFFFESLES